MRAAIALVVTAACLGCGTTRAAPGEREWIANTRGIIRQLQVDLGELSDAGTVADAGKTLTDESRLYAALVVYTDFGGCRHMVAAAGQPPARFAAAERSLGSACTLLEQAAALFTRATIEHDAQALVAAGRVTQKASPFLLRAKAALPP